MLFSKNSQLILRNCEMFKKKRVFFSGNIEDNFPAYLKTFNTKINFQKYSNYINFQKQNILKKNNIYNKLLVSKKMIEDCNTIVYYWPKSKFEAEFQLINIISCLEINTQIFIVGENSSGVKRSVLILKELIDLKKIDNAKHSILITGFIKKRKTFILDNFFRTHQWKNYYIKSLPGVFGYKKIDEGSKLLVSTFSKKINGNVLDMGCGTGFLSICLLHLSPNAHLTLVDNNLAAVYSSTTTLDCNKLMGHVIKSDFFSKIYQKFDLIISNPPFHNNLKINFNMIERIIYESKKYLTFKGELRFVTNSCFNYNFLLKKIFKKYFIIEKTKKYQVYQSFLN